MKKYLLTTSGAASLALALTACGGSTAAETDADSAENALAELEKTELTVGVLPIADYSAVYWADENGFFEDAGLTVELEPLQGGPVGIQKAVSGDIDLSVSNTFSTIIATDGGAPITTVVASGSLGEHTQLIFVQEDSDIQDIHDLDGRTVGTNTTNNVGDVTFENLTDVLDIEIEPNWVEVPFNEMAAGVEAGSIDAGYVPDPFASAAREQGLREVVDLTDEANVGLSMSGFVSSKTFVEENPNTAAAFAEAMYAAGTDIQENEAEFREWLPEIANVTPEVADSMALPLFASEMDVDALQEVADILVSQGRVGEIDMADHTYVAGE